jgi:glycosyltransferase involved in cell wall biosynthesis
MYLQPGCLQELLVNGVKFMLNSTYITAAQLAPEGHGGSVVSYHESKALSEITNMQTIYAHLPGLFLEHAYPSNPFMYDHYIATLIKSGCKIQAAHIFGAFFPMCARRLENAIITFTITGESDTIGLDEENRYFYAAGDVYGDYYWIRETHHVDRIVHKYILSGLQFATAIITPSRNSKVNVLKYDGVETDNIVVIPMGTDIPPMTTPRDIPFKVFHVGSAGAAKGHRYLARAWRSVHSTINGKLVIAGEGTNWIQNSWLADDLTLPHKHQCLGNVPEKVKRAEFLSASVYVQPSINEGWGIPVGEAMSYGIPVIVTNETGAADMVTDGVDGFIIPIRDPDAISEKIRYFYDNPGEIKRMGDNARQKSLDYSWDKFEERYKMFWTKLYSEERL